MKNLADKLKIFSCCCLILIFALVSWNAQQARASNDAYGDGAYGSCTYSECPITLTTSGTVNLDVIPASGATCTVANDAVGVTTDSSTGYNLTLNDSSTTSSMTGSSSSIAAISATQASPAQLTSNTWGYRVDSIGGFGTGPTSSASNVSPPSATFAAVPTSLQTSDTVTTSSLPADPTVTTNVWYGLCANDSTPAEPYSSSVVYTALIN